MLSCGVKISENLKRRISKRFRSEVHLLRQCRTVCLINIVQHTQIEALIPGETTELLHQRLVSLLRSCEDPQTCIVGATSCSAALRCVHCGLASADECIALLFAV